MEPTCLLNKSELLSKILEIRVAELEGLLITNIDQFCECIDRLIEDIEAAGLTEQYDARIHKILDRIDDFIAQSRVTSLELSM
ncbi:MAG: hypothetical protein RPS47_01380 [Colwellia sp.]